MGLLIAITLATLLISATCSLFEAVLYSSRMGSLEAAREAHPEDARVRRMILLKQRISVPIAAILILNTVANTGGAALAGREYQRMFEGANMALFTLALTIAVLVSNHDEFVLTRFRNFCLVDHGMFHLTDLHKKYSRDARYLILSGDDRRDPGRDLKIRGGQLLQDAWRFLGVDITFRVMTDTGHEFGDREMELVGRWLRGEGPSDSPPAALKRIEK